MAPYLTFVTLITLWTVTNSLSTTEYTQLSTTEMQTVDDLPWPIFGLIFGIMIGISASGLFYWIHATYFLYRRYRHGISSHATVICRELKEYPGHMDETNKYHVKYVYTDRRSDITEKCIDQLVSSFISTYYHSSSTYNFIPDDIKNIIRSYLHNSIVFWYGPYEIECVVSEELYRESYTGSKVDIKYDPLYPKNCELFLEPIWHSYCYWIRWFAGFLTSISGCIFFSFIISPKLKENYCQPFVIVTVASALAMLGITVLGTCWFKGSGCFRNVVKGKLKVVQFDEDDNDNENMFYKCSNPECYEDDGSGSEICECDAETPVSNHSNHSNKIHEFIHKNELLYEQYGEVNIVYVQTNMELSTSVSNSNSNSNCISS